MATLCNSTRCSFAHSSRTRNGTTSASRANRSSKIRVCLATLFIYLLSHTIDCAVDKMVEHTLTVSASADDTTPTPSLPNTPVRRPSVLHYATGASTPPANANGTSHQGKHHFLIHLNVTRNLSIFFLNFIPAYMHPPAAACRGTSRKSRLNVTPTGSLFSHVLPYRDCSFKVDVTRLLFCLQLFCRGRLAIDSAAVSSFPPLCYFINEISIRRIPFLQRIPCRWSRCVFREISSFFCCCDRAIFSFRRL